MASEHDDGECEYTAIPRTGTELLPSPQHTVLEPPSSPAFSKILEISLCTRGMEQGRSGALRFRGCERLFVPRTLFPQRRFQAHDFTRQIALDALNQYFDLVW